MEEINYKLITTKDELNQAINHLSKQDSLYLDLEFDKNHFTYGFNLCLMQIASDEKCFLIDPQADLDIEMIFPVLTNPKIRKFTYAFSEDIRLLHHLGCMIKNVADLATARILLNYNHVSLNNLIEEMTGITFGKSHQKSNWEKRPLTEDQLKYAAVDVVFLPQIAQDTIKELEKEGRLGWFEDEISYLDTTDYSKSSHFITVKESDKKYYTKREWLRYLALLEFREDLAKEINRPGYRVIDKKILELLAKKPEQISEWPNFKMNIHRKIKNSETKQNIIDLLASLEERFIAEKIPESAPAREQLSQLEKVNRNKQRASFNRKKSEYFQPLKDKIKSKYGENLANYLLSNRMVIRYFYEGVPPLPYQKKIFEQEMGGWNVE